MQRRGGWFNPQTGRGPHGVLFAKVAKLILHLRWGLTCKVDAWLPNYLIVPFGFDVTQNRQDFSHRGADGKSLVYSQGSPCSRHETANRKIDFY